MSKKRLRHCPALEQPISPADCGENRISNYACPSECSFNPFSPQNYDNLLELEKQFDKTLFKRAISDDLARPAVESLFSQPSSETTLQLSLDHELFHRLHRDGSTFAQRWENDGLAGLRNDGKTIFNSRRQLRLELIEIREIRDGLLTLAQDLLQPDSPPALYADRSLASRACRFERYLSLVCPYPHFKRLQNIYLPIPDFSGAAPLEILRLCAAHLDGSLDQAWLRPNLPTLFDALHATATERQRLTLLKTDLVEATADYALKGNWKTLLGRLVVAEWPSEDPETDEAEQGFALACICPAASQTDSLSRSLAGQPYLGVALLAPKRVRLKATSRENLQALKNAFEAIAKKSATFTGEKIQDLALREALETPSPNAALVPLSLLQGAEGMKFFSSRVPDASNAETQDLATGEFLQSYYQSLLDETIPQLDNLSPRQALQDLLARPKAIEWLKGLIRSTDHSNLRSGTAADINWIAKELDLPELDLPPPPPRPIPEDPRQDEDFEAYPEPDDVFPPHPETSPFQISNPATATTDPANLLDFPSRSTDSPFSAPQDPLFDEDVALDAIEELSRTIERRMTRYPTAADVLDDMEAKGCHLIDEMYGATENLLDDDDFDLCVIPMATAWMALAPEKKPLPIPPGLAQSCVNEAVAGLDRLEQGPITKDATAQLVALSRQPELLLLLWEQLEAVRDQLPKKKRPSPPRYAAMMVALLATANTLSDALKSK